MSALTARTKKPGGFLRKVRQNWIMLLMVLPAVLYFLIFNYLPMPGIILAFKRFNYAQGIFASPWAGLENFRFFFGSGDAWFLTRNTILYNVAFLLVGTALQVLVAVMLSEMRLKLFKKVTQTMMFLPYFISMVVIGAFMYNIFNYEFGAFNTILTSLGMERVNVYSDPGVWPWILIVLNTWKGLGYGIVLYLAAIMGIDTEIYEAADIDGANTFQKIRVITIPCLLPTIITLTLMAIGKIFYSDFGLFYQVPMNSGPLLDVTNTIDTYVYRGLMSLNNISMASAAGVYQSLIGFLLVLVANFVVKKLSAENALF